MKKNFTISEKSSNFAPDFVSDKVAGPLAQLVRAADS